MRRVLMRPLVAFQAFLFLFWLPLQPIGMRVAGPVHLWKHRPPYRIPQALTLILHFSLYGLFLAQLGNWGMVVSFLLVHQGIMGIYNGLVFAPNHKGMTAVNDDSKLSFLQGQILTARNVRGNALVDLYFGGLNYQIEHHLFPTLPRNRFRQAQKMVKELCSNQGIHYYDTSIIGAYGDLFRHLHLVSSPLRRLGWPFTRLTEGNLGAN